MVREHGGDGEIVVPPTIHALLQARIDSLDGDVRVVMERGSVEGEVFHRGAVAELSPDPVRAGVEAHLATLVRKELIRSTLADVPRRRGLPLPPPAHPRRRVRVAAEGDPRRAARALRRLARDARPRRARRDRRLPPRAGAPLPSASSTPRPGARGARAARIASRLGAAGRRRSGPRRLQRADASLLRRAHVASARDDSDARATLAPELALRALGGGRAGGSALQAARGDRRDRPGRPSARAVDARIVEALDGSAPRSIAEARRSASEEARASPRGGGRRRRPRALLASSRAGRTGTRCHAARDAAGSASARSSMRDVRQRASDALQCRARRACDPEPRTRSAPRRWTRRSSDRARSGASRRAASLARRCGHARRVGHLCAMRGRLDEARELLATARRDVPATPGCT